MKLGIDCGGTKISYKIFDRETLVYENKFFQTGNLNFNKNLYNLLAKEIEILNQKWPIKVVTIGIAGYNENIDQIAFESLRTKMKIILMNDLEALYEANFGTSDGAIVACGTGSAIFVKKDNKKYEFGGWGALLGDEGSGYDVGKKIIRKYLIACEVGEINTINAFESKSRIKNRELINEIYADEPIKNISQYSMLFENEKAFSTCYAQSSHELCHLIKINNNIPKTILISGSMFNNMIFLETFKQEMKTYSIIIAEKTIEEAVMFYE